MFPSLQSHGLRVKKWVPPKATRFISYTESDEPWANYCGLGSYVEVPAPWFDVMDEGGQIRLGWIRIDPVAATRDRLVIPFTDQEPLKWRQENESVEFRAISTVSLERRTWCGASRYSVADCFTVWSCCRSNFVDLVGGNGIAVRSISDIRRAVKCVN